VTEADTCRAAAMWSDHDGSPDAPAALRACGCSPRRLVEDRWCGYEASIEGVNRKWKS